jgi:hypothetical protein
MQTLTSILLPLRGTGIALTRIADQEAWKYADDVFRPLYLAGWHSTDNDVGAFVPLQYGILLCVPEHLRSYPAAIALVTALRQADIDFSVDVGGDDELRLIVGLKPSIS